ncbi:short-chain dehydrogenase/reductase [Streptomyces sp. NPDC058620]|uniref:short-chain dehydrogenase/reductase n=1 Tax=Streptomyces sp. NPDC058620 TaxID=3346560 RepID=UPI003652663D
MVTTEHGKRPFRVDADPAGDRSEEVSVVVGPIRAEFLTRIGIDDRLTLRSGV